MDTSAQSPAPRPNAVAPLVVVYDALLDRTALGQSIGADAAASKSMRPVIVNGYRRLFNLRPEQYESSSALGDAGNENGALNVEPAAGSSFNGLAFTVTAQELTQLDEHARHQMRSEAVVNDFETGDEVGNCFVYAAAPGAELLEFDTGILMPLWHDVERSRKGAYAVSPEFGEYFDRTTFLADATTLVVDRYRDLLTDPPPSS